MDEMGIGAALQQPVAGNLQQPVPMPEPQVLEERKGMWRTFLERMKTDPNLRSALMATGVGLLRSPQIGQNGFDVFANAAAQGMSTFQEGRKWDQQSQMANRKLGTEERVAEAGIKNDTTRAANDTLRTQEVVTAGEASRERTEKLDVTAETQRLLDNVRNDKKLSIEEKNAASDRIRANAYAEATRVASTGGGSTGQNVQLVNQRKAALMKLNPGMTDEEATLTAQNDIVLSKQGGNPMSVAKSLYETGVKAWMANFENLGKSMPPEVNQQIKDEALATAKTWAKSLGGDRPQSGTQGGVIIRDGSQPAPQDSAPETLVGRKMQVRNGTAEIVAADASTVTVRGADGRTRTIPLEQATPHIIAE